MSSPQPLRRAVAKATPAPVPAPIPDTPSPARLLPLSRLIANEFSIGIYGDPGRETDGLLESIQEQGILVPLVVARATEGRGWEILSGHRRAACARAIGLEQVPCQVRAVPPGTDRQHAVLDYNRQRNKTFSQRMREADALHDLLAAEAAGRSRLNLRRGPEQGEGENPLDGRNSDARGRTDAALASAVGLGGKDLYRQARAIWQAAEAGDPRASAAVGQLDAGTKTVHAAYKDLRRRDRFTSGFRPSPYDVWPFRHDDAFGVPHPGAIPAEIIAHAVHYFSPPGGLVVDPMAGGGTTLDVCQAMGRRCLSYDLHPVRPEILPHDLRNGLPAATAGCDLLFCDPPYHTMLSGRYPGKIDAPGGIGELPLDGWIAFLQSLSRDAFLQIRPGGHVALLLANQTEKDLPAGYGYLDHVFLGYNALIDAGFQPVRRISCPMAGGYRPQQIRRAREDGRLLGLVRDLLVMRKPAVATPPIAPQIPSAKGFRSEPVW